MLTLALLPGMDGTGDLFGPFIEALDGAFATSVVRYPADVAMDYAALTAIARDALPRHGPFLLLGESFSGPIAVSLAAEKPDGLLGVVLCNTFVRSPLPMLSPLRKLARIMPFGLAPLPAMDYFLLGGHSTPNLKLALAAALAKVSTRALQARMEAVMAVDVSDKLRAVEVPMIYLQATHDRLVSSASALHLQAQCPGMQLLTLDGPHCLLQASPMKTAEAVIAFGRQIAADCSAN
jgi:pimeloyl-ACP methyl ester carboxylesterase